MPTARIMARTALLLPPASPHQNVIPAHLASVDGGEHRCDGMAHDREQRDSAVALFSAAGSSLDV
jgi:hypothetical protein